MSGNFTKAQVVSTFQSMGGMASLNAVSDAMKASNPDAGDPYMVVIGSIKDKKLFEKVEKGVYKLIADAPAADNAVVAPAEPEVAPVVEAAPSEAPVKAKRHRRTKAEMEAYRAELAANPPVKVKKERSGPTWLERVKEAVEALDKDGSLGGVRPIEAETWLRAKYAEDIKSAHFAAEVRSIIQNEKFFKRLERGRYTLGEDNRAFAKSAGVAYPGMSNYGGGRNGVRKDYRTVSEGGASS